MVQGTAYISRTRLPGRVVYGQHLSVCVYVCVCKQAIKYGFIFGVERPNLEFKMPSKQEFQAAAEVCEQVLN